MGSKVVIALSPLILAGCLTPFTSRLDEANSQAARLNQQLVIATAKLDEVKAIMQESQTKLDEANLTFNRMDTRMTEMDRKFGTIELGFRKMFGIKGDGKDE
jgi:outer membrane murein-binding lipoprotein Lpp